MRLLFQAKMLRSGARSRSKPHPEDFMQIAKRLSCYWVTIQLFHDESHREHSFYIHRNIVYMDVFSSENTAGPRNGQANVTNAISLCVNNLHEWFGKWKGAALRDREQMGTGETETEFRLIYWRRYVNKIIKEPVVLKECHVLSASSCEQLTEPQIKGCQKCCCPDKHMRGDTYGLETGRISLLCTQIWPVVQVFYPILIFLPSI